MSKIIGITVGTPINPAKFEGKSAYEIAKLNGFEGTEAEWLESLQGKSGVYVGSGNMPDDCNVQVDLTGQSLSQIDFVDPAVDAVLTGLTEGLILKDTVTKQYYKLFSSNGKLTMEETTAPVLKVINGSEVAW